MTFILKILGSNSAAPAHNRHQTSQLLNIQNQLFLIDCGEGTQLQLAKYHVKINRINNIFISHLHGDHFFGLMGLISTMHLYGRKKNLTIYGPPGLAEIITLQLKYSESNLNFRVILNELQDKNPEKIFENEFMTVDTIPLVHRVFCNGFLFREKPKPRKINKEKLPANFTLNNIIRLKKGFDIENEAGEVIYKNKDYTLPPKHSYSYAYCSDTLYHEDLIDQVNGVDLLYHESTFMDDMKERAVQTYHSTARQAASIGLKAKVGQLILGHYSVRYKDLTPLLEEARQVFPNSQLGVEGQDIVLAKY